jgi:polysaccharide export outer membrane protein
MRRILLALWALCLLAPGVQAQESYQIRIGDRLDISVLEDPNLNRIALVRPDGRISMPIVGSITAAGQTPEALQRAITARLRDSFAISPNVTVALAGLGPQERVAPPEPDVIEIFVMGEVSRPGKLTLDTGTTLLQALAQVGGLSAFAATGRVQLRRIEPASGREDLIIFDYEAVQRGAYMNSVVQMMDGDVIIVPERKLLEF